MNILEATECSIVNASESMNIVSDDISEIGIHDLQIDPQSNEASTSQIQVAGCSSGYYFILNIFKY